MNEKSDSDGLTPRAGKPPYEAPKIEEIVTAAELEREVHYAGVTVSVPGPQ